ncbi:hypothetical protein W97_05697 [Coniosporium apollinis CBS 100218]|uniref:Uncharacterized protein n=1 Tax=Coniosporium apollinis (strain CBS 100218) TaxID=1168221 RepID=R7YWW8_CONA1|nr:uncharacterized protein W97_05697 [Coniosporium apollinis CBS 100218]EON66304.1 hypothetical protein W97_05697 [Coniosporium apollinis CBS 100218]
MPTGPVDKSLVNAVREFLKDVDRIYDPAHHDDEGIVAEIDEMGQTIGRDEMVDLVLSEAYYGWSLAFCQQMKKRMLEDRPVGQSTPAWTSTQTIAPGRCLYRPAESCGPVYRIHQFDVSGC